MEAGAAGSAGEATERWRGEAPGGKGRRGARAGRAERGTRPAGPARTHAARGAGAEAGGRGLVAQPPSRARKPFNVALSATEGGRGEAGSRRVQRPAGPGPGRPAAGGTAGPTPTPGERRDPPGTRGPLA